MYTVQFQRIARSCQRSAIGQETQSGEGSRLQAPVLTCSTSHTYPTAGGHSISEQRSHKLDLRRFHCSSTRE